MATTEKIEGGWGPVSGSRRWHYFGADHRALCGGAMFFGPLENLEQGNDASADNCAACRKKLATRKKSK